MSTTLLVKFIVLFGIEYFVLVVSNIHWQKMRCSGSSQISMSKKSILVILGSLISTYKILPGRGWFFPVSTFTEAYCREKMSSVTGPTKSYSISPKSTKFGHLRLHRSTFKVDFLKIRAKLRKILGQFHGLGLLETMCKILSFLGLLACGEGLLILQVDIFKNPWF